MRKLLIPAFLFCLFFSACQKDDIDNKAPVVNAGKDTTITLNITTGNNITLKGSATDADGTVVSYLWSQVSGPNKANIETAGSATTIVNGLISGIYVFQLMATDDDGAVGSKTVSITITQNNPSKGPNVPPIVNAGNDTTFTLQTTFNDTINLKGSATDADGTVVGYAWAQISGPTSSKILYQGSASTKVTNVIAGTYIFQLMAIDDQGATGVETVTITLQAPVLITLTLQPNNNVNETLIAIKGSTAVSNPNAPEVAAVAWTESGIPSNYRGLFKFDFSSLPSGAKISSAKLSLYSDPTPLNGNLVDANFGTDNAMLIQRITGTWNSSVTWPTQPAVDAATQLLISATTQSKLDLIDVDVTDLVKDMQQFGNNGFMIKLQNEVIYNSRIFCSSKHSDASRHPKLIIQYTN